MTNPFPGMNPYLEDPRLRAGVHHRLVTYLADALSARLPEGYMADIDERVYVEKPEALRIVAPDVALSRGETGPSAIEVTAGTLVADPPLTVEMELAPVREPFVQVFSLRGRERQLVTVIRVLIPGNKTPGAPGSDLYLEKQRALVNSTVHLMEVDLLHNGDLTVSVPSLLLERYTGWDYVICLHKGGWHPGKFAVWLVPLRNRLPRVIVPLAEDEPDVVIDLQEVLNLVYTQGRYDSVIDYAAEPPANLNEKDCVWLDGLLREKGLR